MNKIIEFYQYLFYKYSTWDWWYGKVNSMACQTGCAVLAVLWGFVLLIFSGMVNLLIGYDFFCKMKNPKLMVAVFFCLIYSFHYMVFLRNKKYKKIIKKFDSQETKYHFPMKSNFIALSVLGFFFYGMMVAAYFSSFGPLIHLE